MTTGEKIFAFTMNKMPAKTINCKNAPKETYLLELLWPQHLKWTGLTYTKSFKSMQTQWKIKVFNKQDSRSF